MAANNQAPVAYFLDQLLTDIEASKLPSSARDVVIAKVRVLEHPSWLGKRHSADLPRDVFFIRLRILDVRRGSAAIAADYNIYFGERGKDMVFPNTPEQLGRECIVMMYLDADDAKHRLVGFPISNVQCFDDVGSAVTDTNIVAAQMGLDLWMSYPADIMNNDPNDNRFSEELRTDISYSDNQSVSVVKFGDNAERRRCGPHRYSRRRPHDVRFAIRVAVSATAREFPESSSADATAFSFHSIPNDSSLHTTLAAAWHI